MTYFKRWIKKNYLDIEGDPDNSDLKMMASNISGGVGGMIYYNETSAIYDQHKEELWDLLSEMSESCGYKTPLELIASFIGAKNVWDDLQFKNLIVWACAEHCAREILDEIGAKL